MRLIPKNKQDEIYNNIYQFYEKSKYKFILKRNNLQTISGDDEGYYGWLAVNYLGGTISANLERIKPRTIGALDLGGGSTQILFEPYDVSPETPVTQENIFMHSFLGTGAEEFYNKYIHTILNESTAENIINPCLNTGFEEEYINKSIKGDGNVFLYLYYSIQHVNQVYIILYIQILIIHLHFLMLKYHKFMVIFMQ